MQRTVSTTFISFPLAKFSRSTDVAPGATNFSWNHATSDLFVVIDTFRAVTFSSSSSPSQQLKIVQGTQIIEQIAIEELVRQSHQLITTMRHLNAEVKNEHLPVSALVQRPLLALRWNLPEPSNLVRRIQMRFVANADYDTVFNHLRSLGLNMSDTRPSTAPASKQPPSTDMGGTLPRTSEASMRPMATPSPSTTPRISSPLARSAVSNAISTRPSTSPLNPGFADHRSTEMVSTVASPVMPLEHLQPLRSPASTTTPYSKAPSPEQAALSGGFTTTLPQPTFTPLLTNLRDEDTLPPRRELPFARPPSKSSGNETGPTTGRLLRSSNRRSMPPTSAGKDGAAHNGQSSSSTVGSSPMPFSSQGIQQSTFGPRLAPKPSLQVPTFIPEASEPTQSIPNTSRPSSGVSDLPPLPTPTFINEDESKIEAVRVGVPRVRGNTVPSTTSGQESRPPPFATSGRLSSNRVLTNQSTPTERVFRELDHLRNIAAGTELAAYVAESPEMRQEILDGFLLNLLDNEDFLILVEDVSVCWTRIALGLG